MEYTYDKALPQRKNVRLPQHNYAWTAWYFVTLHANGFGSIFEHPVLHDILQSQWDALGEHFPQVRCDEFVIMPDHVHFVIRLDGDVTKPVTLGNVVGAYKSLTSVEWLRYVRTNPVDGEAVPAKIWQRKYVERIIHSQQELEWARRYTRDNPTAWAKNITTSHNT